MNFEQVSFEMSNVHFGMYALHGLPERTGGREQNSGRSIVFENFKLIIKPLSYFIWSESVEKIYFPVTFRRSVATEMATQREIFISKIKKKLFQRVPKQNFLISYLQ